YGAESQLWSEWWTLWRRVAGGLDELAQETLLVDLAPALRPVAERIQKSSKSGKSTARPAYDDMVRLAASLERLPAARKVEIGGWWLARLTKKGESPQTWWALGRLGCRVPLYGSAHNVVPREVAADWLRRILELNWKTVEPAAFAATLLARLSGDRERDLPEELRLQVVQKLRSVKAPESWLRLVEQVVELEEADEKRVFGEALPPGLRLMH
ncbi:MAG TPA: molecular chaperone DnaK, partial [Candidatus Competibacteraceae bacterium]|nr:molecular chaperone DnaK [Candidatus Competibacteraceae bacterium]